MSSHWSEKYLGVPYNKKQNCSWFVNHVLKSEFNKSYDFPRLDESKRVCDQSTLIDKYIRDYGFEITAQELKDGDAVLMMYDCTKNWHIGLFYRDTFGKARVMHSDSGFQSSVSHKFVDLQFVNLKAISYYRFI